MMKAGEKKWFDAFDHFLYRNPADGLEMAAQCDHPDALTLLALFPNGVRSWEDVHRICSSAPETALTLFLRGFNGNKYSHNYDLISRAALKGHGRACFFMAQKAQYSADTRESQREALLWAERGLVHADRSGLHQLGEMYSLGIECERNLEKAKECFRRAAEMGDTNSAGTLGHYLADDDPEKFFWMATSKELGGFVSEEDVGQFLRQIEKSWNAWLESRGHWSKVVFQIGASLKHVDFDERTLFGSQVDWRSPDDEDLEDDSDPELISRDRKIAILKLASEAVDLHLRWSEATRDAVVTWVMCAKVHNLHPDMRRHIAKIIWATRNESCWMDV
jgi:hypothetical protein